MLLSWSLLMAVLAERGCVGDEDCRASGWGSGGGVCTDAVGVAEADAEFTSVVGRPVFCGAELVTIEAEGVGAGDTETTSDR